MKNENEPGGDCGVDAYTGELIEWLSVRRLAYIDQLQADGLIARMQLWTNELRWVGGSRLKIS